MGELRFNGAEGGAWGRTYGNKYNVADGSGVDISKPNEVLRWGPMLRCHSATDNG